MARLPAQVRRHGGSASLSTAGATEGERAAYAQLVPQLYDEMRSIARRLFRRERQDHTLQATAVVHEAYIRFAEQGNLRWQSRAHFLGVAAAVMRRVLVDYSRRHNRLKRGGGVRRVTLAETALLVPGRDPDVEALDDALRDLATLDPVKASIVELRFFGGLTIDEVAACLGLAPITVSRHWRRAKAWLYKQLASAAAPEHSESRTARGWR